MMEPMSRFVTVIVKPGQRRFARIKVSILSGCSSSILYLRVFVVSETTGFCMAMPKPCCNGFKPRSMYLYLSSRKHLVPPISARSAANQCLSKDSYHLRGAPVNKITRHWCKELSCINRRVMIIP